MQQVKMETDIYLKKKKPENEFGTPLPSKIENTVQKQRRC